MVFALQFLSVVATSLVVAANGQALYSELAKRVAPAATSLVVAANGQALYSELAKRVAPAATSLVVAANGQALYSELAKRVAPADESLYLRCMHCFSEHNIIDCLGVIKCLASSEVCSIQKVYDPYFNQTFIKAGCTTKRYCDTTGCFEDTGTQDPSLILENNQTLECNYCCDTEFCNIYGCPESGNLGLLPSPRCLHCTFVDYPHDCPAMINCAIDSICVLNVVVHGGVERYNVGCEKTTICEHGFNTTFNPHHKRQVLHHPELGIMLHSDCCADHLCNSVFPIQSNAATNHSNYICPPRTTLPPTTTTTTTTHNTTLQLLTTSQITTHPHTQPTKPQISPNNSNAVSNGHTTSPTMSSAATQNSQSVIYSQIQPSSSFNVITEISSVQIRTSYILQASSLKQVTIQVSPTVSGIQSSSINQGSFPATLSTSVIQLSSINLGSLPATQSTSWIQSSSINQGILSATQSTSGIQSSSINQGSLPATQSTSWIQSSSINQGSLPATQSTSGIQSSSINQGILPATQSTSWIQSSSINQGSLPATQSTSGIQLSSINLGSLPATQSTSWIQSSSTNQGSLSATQSTSGLQLSSINQGSLPSTQSTSGIQSSSINQGSSSATQKTSGIQASSTNQISTPVLYSSLYIQPSSTIQVKPSVSFGMSGSHVSTISQVTIPASPSFSKIQTSVTNYVLPSVLSSISSSTTSFASPVPVSVSTRYFTDLSRQILQTSSQTPLPESSSVTVKMTSVSPSFVTSNRMLDLRSSFLTTNVQTSATQITPSQIQNFATTIPLLTNYTSMTHAPSSQISKSFSTIKPTAANLAFPTQLLPSLMQNSTSRIKSTKVMSTSSNFKTLAKNSDSLSSIQIIPTQYTSSSNHLSPSSGFNSASMVQSSQTTPTLTSYMHAISSSQLLLPSGMQSTSMIQASQTTSSLHASTRHYSSKIHLWSSSGATSASMIQPSQTTQKQTSTKNAISSSQISLLSGVEPTSTSTFQTSNMAASNLVKQVSTMSTSVLSVFPIVTMPYPSIATSMPVTTSASAQPVLMSPLSVPSMVTKLTTPQSMSSQLNTVTPSPVLNNVLPPQQQTTSVIQTQTQFPSLSRIQNTHQTKLFTSQPVMQLQTSSQTLDNSMLTTSTIKLDDSITTIVPYVMTSLPNVLGSGVISSLVPTMTLASPVVTSSRQIMSNSGISLSTGSTQSSKSQSIATGFDHSSVPAESTQITSSYGSTSTMFSSLQQNALLSSEKSTSAFQMTTPYDSSITTTSADMMKQNQPSPSIKILPTVLQTTTYGQNTIVFTSNIRSSTRSMSDSPLRVETSILSSSHSEAASKMAVIHPTKVAATITTMAAESNNMMSTHSDLPDLTSSVISPSETSGTSSWSQNTDSSVMSLQSSIPVITSPSLTQRLKTIPVSTTENTLITNPTHTLLTSVDQMQTMIATSISSDLGTTSSAMNTDIVSSQISSIQSQYSIISDVTKQSNHAAYPKSDSLPIKSGVPVNIQPIG